MKKTITITSVLGSALLLCAISCKRDPYKPDFDHAGGYVIGRETCKADITQDYWLIDLSIDYTVPNSFGDTLTVNGITYNHLVKTAELPAPFKVAGKKLSFDCRFSSARIQTTGCTVPAPVTYDLKVMTILASGEVR